MGTLDETISARIVTRNAYMMDVILLREMRGGLEEGRAVVGDNLRERTPSAYYVFVDPIAESPS